MYFFQIVESYCDIYIHIYIFETLSSVEVYHFGIFSRRARSERVVKYISDSPYSRYINRETVDDRASLVVWNPNMTQYKLGLLTGSLCYARDDDGHFDDSEQSRKCALVTADDKNHVRVPRPPPKTRLYAGNFALARVTAVTDAARMHTEGSRDSNLRALTSVSKYNAR